MNRFVPTIIFQVCCLAFILSQMTCTEKNQGENYNGKAQKIQKTTN